MISDAISIDFLPSAAAMHVVNANYSIALFPRGGGKTTFVIGPRILRLKQVMPRSQILLFSDTFERLEKRIVPNIVYFLTSKAKLIEDIDFVKYKKPPDHWIKPLIPLDKFDRVISFSDGTALCLVSLAVEGSGNAYNAVAAIGDEVKFCDEKQINAEVRPALRGNEDMFGHLPEYLSIWMCSDKYGANVKWLLNIRDKKVNQPAVDVVMKLQERILELDQEKDKYTSTATLYKYKHEIDELTNKCNRIRKHLVFVSDMPAYENKIVLGDFYFKSQKRTCTTLEYDVAILNKDPNKVENSFYPTFTGLNKYKGVKDYNPYLPFFGAMDYQFAISPLPLAQVSRLPGSVYTTVNIIDYLYELDPLGIEDTVKAFCKKYNRHINKTFNYIIDHTAIGRTPTKRKFKDVFIESFDESWTVIEHYIGQAPDHDIKHEMLKACFLCRGEFAVMVNEITCDQLIKSVDQSPAIIVKGKTQKDKRTEGKLETFPAEDSTHGSDALDQLLWGLFEHGLKDVSNDEVDIMRTR